MTEAKEANGAACTGVSVDQKAESSCWTKYGTCNRLPTDKIPMMDDESKACEKDISLESQRPEDPVGLPATNRNGRFRHCLGIFFTILSAMTFSFTALIGKLLNHLNPFDLAAWTFLFMTILCALAVLYEIIVKKNTMVHTIIQNDHPARTLFCLLVRVVAGVGGLILFYTSVKYLTVADAIVIDGCSPIIVYILAFFFFGEKFGILPVLTTVIAFAGVALITRPPLLSGGHDKFDTNTLIGVGLAFLATLSITSAIIAMKFLEKVHHTLITFSFSLFGAIICSLVAWLCGSLAFPSDTKEMLTLVMSGVLFYVGKTFLTLALQYEDAGPVGLLRTTEVIFVFLWQFLFLGVSPDIFSICGAILVIIGAVLTITRRWISVLPTDHKFRTKCNMLLY